MPMAGTMSGNSTAGVGLWWMVRNAAKPKMSDEMMVIS